MGQQILNAIIPVAMTFILAIIAIVIKELGGAGVNFLIQKKEQITTKIGIDKYNSLLVFAEKVWLLVDEYFRITPNVIKTIDNAQLKFKQEILKKFPQLTDAEIDQIRQIIAGEINAGREVITSPATKSLEK